MLSRFSLVLALLAALSQPAGGARADQKDPRLDELFQRLRTVTGSLERRNIEQQIWAIWGISDNDEVNRLMAEGVQAMQAQDYRAALVDFSRMIEIAPDFAEGWNKRATVLYQLQDYEGSRADVARTLALEPRHFGALSGLGLINAEEEREEEAIAAWEKALAINPNMPAARANIEAMRERLKEKQI